MVFSTTLRSRATGARISKTTGMLAFQYCRSPRKTLRTSARVRLFTGVSGCTTIATSASWLCAAMTAQPRPIQPRSRRTPHAGFEHALIAPLEGKRSLEKSAADTRFPYPLTKVSILALECGVVRNIVSHPNQRTDQVCHAGRPRDIPHRLHARPMNILEAIIRLPFALLPGKPVRQLHIVGRGVKCLGCLQIPVMNIGVLCEKFRALLVPHHVRRGDPLVEVRPGARRKLVAIIGATNFQPVEPGRSGKQIGYPRPVVIHIAAVSGPAEHRVTTVA